MAVAGGARVPLRVECAVYGIGGISTTMHFMAMTIVPLWVVQLELSPIWLGLVLGCRPVLPLFLSIHVGALLDRMGARRVMLIFAILGMLAPLLYPALPWIWAIVVAQLLWGLADTTSWIGVQALVGKMMEGRTVYAGRLSFVSRIANMIGPLLVARWAIFTKKGERVITSWQSSFAQKVGTSGFEPAAAALSKLVAKLSQDIATTVKTLPRINR